MKVVRILDLQNASEAGLLESVLKEQGIPHAIRSLHDTAFDGIYQTHAVWGWVEADEDLAGRIRDIHADIIRNRDAYSLVEDDADVRVVEAETAAEKKRRAKSLIRLIVIALAILAGAILIAILFYMAPWRGAINRVP